MTLFDDDELIPRMPRRRYVWPCCRLWDDFVHEYPNIDLGPWAVLHKYSHSRLAFTELTLSINAHVHMAVARVMCTEAQHRRWIVAPQLDGPVPESSGFMWVGALAHDR